MRLIKVKSYQKANFVQSNLKIVVEVLVLEFHTKMVRISKVFVHVVSCVLCVRPHMLMSERIVTIFELMCSGLRTTMTLESLDDVLQIRLNMPPVSNVTQAPGNFSRTGN